MNIVSLTDLESERQFEAHFRSLPRIVLEGRSDVGFFTAWFEHLLTELDFVAADTIADGGGCTAVATAVRQSVDGDGIPALGIVDRDWLHREQHWEELYSLDAASLSRVSPDDLVTTSLWEIEAYLLLPQLVSRWVGMQRNPPPATAAEKDAALGKVLEECEALLHAMPFFASAHVAGKHCHVKHFSDVSHHNMPQKCHEVRQPLFGEPLEIFLKVQSLVDQIRANAPADPAERLQFLLRYLDTRRLLERIGVRLGLHNNAHHALAELMSVMNCRPAELEQILNEAVRQFEDA
ncbi:MAG TPA: hypothetical protein VF503_19585 [Sphingobium sp.]|uniref:hypothetical protein n=1 Tax=Sphingobium sp. TaxID=1912891 RepID=UPI002ED1507C